MSTNPIKDQINKQLAQTANGLREVVNNAQRRELPESAFVTHFVPLFSGQIKDQAEFDTLLSAWFTIAGDPFNEVDVICDDKTVLTIPAIYDMANIKPRTKRSQDGLTMDAQLNIIQNNERTNPRMTMNIMANIVNQTEADLTSTMPQVSENLLRLRQIIAKYTPGYKSGEQTTQALNQDKIVFDTCAHDGY